MGAIGKWFRHIVTGMAQGCLVLALLAGVVSLVGSFIATGHVPTGWTLTLIIGIMVVSGLLGAVGALAWRLSHIEEIAHAVEEVAHVAEHSRHE